MKSKKSKNPKDSVKEHIQEETQSDLVKVASFDIGKKNFAFYVEEFDRQDLKNITNIDIKQRYNLDGSPTPKMKEILERIYKNGRTILHKNVDLTKDCDPKKPLDTETYYNMIDVLDEHAEVWDECLCFVIEEQMSFGKKLNKTAVKLGQHCYSYFTFKYGRFKPVFEFHAYYKTQILGAPKEEVDPCKSGKRKFKTMEKGGRKKWAVTKLTEVLNLRGETEVLDTVKSVKKKDDLSDTLCQLQAWKYLALVDKSL
jgi:hypothetical protein